MPQLTLLPPGPISAAVGPYADEALDRVDPAGLLADLIDLRGGVQLAEQLADLADAVGGELTHTPAEVRGRVDDVVRHVEERLADAWAHASKPRYRLPGPERALATLDRAGALQTRKGRAVKTAARNLWAPFGDFVDTHARRARFALRDVRGEIGPMLTGLGPRAARLERLDAALTEATRRSSEALIRRLPQAFEQSFLRGLRVALKALPAEPVAADLAPGFRADGWVWAHVEQAWRLARAVVDHDRDRLYSLVDGACALARPG